MTRYAITFWVSGLLMDGLSPQFNIGDTIALRTDPAFVIVSLPRRRSIQTGCNSEDGRKKKLTNIAKHRILSLLCC